MQEPLLFEYAVVRVVPRVERQEFLNVGVVLYCRQARFLRAEITLNEARLCAFAAVDCVGLKKALQAFERICNADPSAGPIARLDAAARFRWLTATRSTVVQTSQVHPGFCNDPLEMLLRLHQQLVR